MRHRKERGRKKKRKKGEGDIINSRSMGVRYLLPFVSCCSINLNGEGERWRDQEGGGKKKKKEEKGGGGGKTEVPWLTAFCLACFNFPRDTCFHDSRWRKKVESSQKMVGGGEEKRKKKKGGRGREGGGKKRGADERRTQFFACNLQPFLSNVVNPD